MARLLNTDIIARIELTGAEISLILYALDVLEDQGAAFDTDLFHSLINVFKAVENEGR